MWVCFSCLRRIFVGLLIICKVFVVVSMTNNAGIPTGVAPGRTTIYMDQVLGGLPSGSNLTMGGKGNDSATGGPSAASGNSSKDGSNGKQTFASLFKGNRVPVEASKLNFIAPTEGELVIEPEDIDSVEETHGHCLVGYVMGTRPSPYVMLNFIKGWGNNTKFFYMANGWIKFQFSTAADRDRVLNGGTYMIMGRQLFLKAMPSCFLFTKDEMEFIPTWVQIFGLPKQCCTVPALSKVASVAGKHIHTDVLTISKKGATYARVLVEIDAKKARIHDYSIKLPTGTSTLVQFKYEMEAKYCDKCKSLGHTVEMCVLEKPSRPRPMKQPFRGNQLHHDTNKGKAKVDVDNSKKQGGNNSEPEGSGATCPDTVHEQVIGEELKQTNMEATKVAGQYRVQHFPEPMKKMQAHTSLDDHNQKHKGTASSSKAKTSNNPSFHALGSGTAPAVSIDSPKGMQGHSSTASGSGDAAAGINTTGHVLEEHYHRSSSEEERDPIMVSDSNYLFTDGFELDSEEIEDMTSKEETRSSNKWKRVVRRSKRISKMNKQSGDKHRGQ